MKILDSGLKKGYLLAAFLFLGYGSLFAQAGADIGPHKPVENDHARFLLKGPVNTLIEESFEVHPDGSAYLEPEYRKVCSFDTCGRLLEIILYHPPEPFLSKTYTYNVSGRLIGKVAKRYDSSTIKTTFVYNQQGNLISCKEAYPSYDQAYLYHYDGQERLSRCSFFTNEYMKADERQKRRPFSGNEDLCNTSLPVCDMELKEEIVYEYDGQSQLSAEHWYSYDYPSYSPDSMQWRSRIKLCKIVCYRYDANGEKLEKRSTEAGSVHLIRYNQSGNPVEEQAINDSEKSLEDITIYSTYNAFGDYTGSYYLKDGQKHIVMHVEYVYDSRGNYITSIMHDDRGRINGRIIRRTITYYK